MTVTVTRVAVRAAAVTLFSEALESSSRPARVVNKTTVAQGKVVGAVMLVVAVR